jgi:hypothetical protein
MPPTADPWTDRARDALSRYAEPLRRDVAAKLVKPRTPIPADELADRCVAALTNPPVIDRRVREQPDAARKLLALVGLGRRPAWKVGHLVTLLASLGHAEGLAPVLSLLQAGLLYPELSPEGKELTAFESWLGSAGVLQASVFAHPAVAGRARGEDLGLLELPAEPLAATPRAADGLDWPLRLAVIWQEVDDAPVRLTQANTLFKRDLNRLQTDVVLSAPAADQLAELPDAGVLALFWARSAGLLAEQDNELRAAPFPPSWGGTLAPTLADLWAGLADVEVWDPVRGYAPGETGTSPVPTAGLLALLLLAKADPAGWADPQVVADWLWEHHPSWAGTLPKGEDHTRGRGWVEAYLLGVAYPLGLIEVSSPQVPSRKSEDLGLADLGLGTSGWRVRLAALGRHLLAGGPEPTPGPAFPQTLLVQPNAEVLAYRQGLTPALIGKLSRFAEWKGLGPACTLQLNPTRTYHGLESGLTLAGMTQTLNQHGMKPVPPTVADLLRRWADKRERITVYASATLVEFQTPADLEAAIARGTVSVRVTDRIGLADDGRDPDFQHLRLIGNRDYEARPTQCVMVDGDGVTLTVDPAQSDLLLEAEIGRLAEPVAGDPPGVRRFRLTPESLRRATATGYSLADLDAWFTARAGHALPPAGRLFVLGPQLPPPTAERHLVVHLPTPEVADGLVQWPTTAELVEQRLGPTAVVVNEANLLRFKEVLEGLGIALS